MKKEFINPAVRVIKCEGSNVMQVASPGQGTNNVVGNCLQEAPTRAHIFENSEF